MPEMSRARTIEDLSHPIGEHIRHAKLYLDDTRRSLIKTRRLFWLWIVAAALVIGLDLYQLFR